MNLGCLCCRTLITNGQFCSSECEIGFLRTCRSMKIDGNWLEAEEDRRKEITAKTERKS